MAQINISNFYMDRFSNINSILAFVTVAREGSVSRAADVLNLTQPAISHQLKRLGEDTGIALFTRTPKGLQISHDGAAVLAKAEQVLEAMSEFQRSARQRSGRISGKLRIGTIVDPEFIRLGRVLARLRAEHPDIETELTHGVSGDIMTWLKRGQIDGGFYLCGPDDLGLMGQDSEDPIHAIKLADFTYRVIGPVGWQKKIENANWAELAIVARVDQEASMLEMVRSGIGLSLCRDSIALHQKQSYGIAVCNSVSVPASLCFVALARRKDSPMLSEVFTLLRGAW